MVQMAKQSSKMSRQKKHLLAVIQTAVFSLILLHIHIEKDDFNTSYHFKSQSKFEKVGDLLRELVLFKRTEVAYRIGGLRKMASPQVL